MKIVANLPDINQLFNDGLKDIFPYSNIRVCVIHRVSGEILHIFRDIGKPIRFKDFAFNIKEHDLGLYVPSFYAKRNWKSDDICEDSILTIGANTVSFNGYDAMPIFIRPDGTVRKYVVVGLTRGVMDNGVLRSIPGRYPSSGYTIEEFRTAVRKGRDPKKWGLMNQDMFDCLQLLFKFAFQVTKTKEALGNGLGRDKSLTGGTLVLGGQSGYTDPFQFGKDKPDARLKSLICVVDGRLQFSNWDGKFSPIKIANNKTLDECIVEETEDYIIYSDGVVTPEDPIPEGIYFACRVDKHTGEIYYGEGYENLKRGGVGALNNITVETVINEGDNYHVKFTRKEVDKISGFEIGFKEDKSSGFFYNIDSIETDFDILKVYFGSWGKLTTGDYNIYIKNENDYTRMFTNTLSFINPDNMYNRIWLLIRTDHGTLKSNRYTTGYLRFHKLFVTESMVNGGYVRTKCPAGKLATVTTKNDTDTSYILKDVVNNPNTPVSSTCVPVTYIGPGFSGHLGSIEYNLNERIKDKPTTIIRSSSVGKYFCGNETGSVQSWYTDYLTKPTYFNMLNRTSHGSVSLTSYIFYNGSLSEEELVIEKNKVFKLKKYYRSNKNQSSFLGLEDLFTNNNTKEVLDGTIIDTTKTPIEYKEQKNISLTSDSNSYTKNNINIEKSKCGFIKDIRNTGDFKNIPKDTLVVSGKYDEKYQSPTINNARVVDNRRYDFRVGYGNATSNNTRIYNMDNGITRIENITYDFNSISPIFNSANKATTPALNGRICSFSAKVRGDGKVKLALHQVRGSNGTTSVATFSQVYSNGIDWQTIKIENYVINEHLQNMIVVFENSLTWVEIKEIQFILDNSVAPDYVPPNTDGNFIPTYGNSGMLGLEQTTKDTDKNENTFARLMFLP